MKKSINGQCCLPVAKKSPHHFYQLSFVHEHGLVLDFGGRDPGLDLITEPLQFLDLFLQILFILFLLVGVGRIVNLLPSFLELFHAFGYLF